MRWILFLLLSSSLWAAPDGKALYQKYCSVCHQGQGKGGIGLPLEADILAQVPDDYIERTIRHGRPGRIMPAFNYLSDAQVQAIIRYIRSWSSQPAPQFDHQNLAGNAQKGEVLYQKYCQACHGKDGSGEGLGTGVTLSRVRNFMVMPPALNNPGFQASASDKMIQHIILQGRPKRGMPSFKTMLDQEQIADIIAYIRQLKPKPHPQGLSEWAGQASYMMESPYDLETTINNLKQALQGANFRIFPQRYLEQGLTDEFSHNTRQVGIRFCNFKELYHLLNIEPRLGIVLPCRINVIQAEDRVILVAPNLVEIARLFNNQELLDVAVLMEEVILAVMEEATF